MVRGTLDAALELLLANPFTEGARELEAAGRELVSATADQIERACQASSPSRVMLAVLHARALAGADLGLARGSRRATSFAGEARMAVASARCVLRLRQMRGTSRALARVRTDVWSACFGRTLQHGLALEAVVRNHDVIVTGETGTGKEEVARALGEGLPGADAHSLPPFAEINAAAVPETLVESELFGHEKGAFTGASEARKGLVRSADKGCLFLDEVGDLPLPAQAKLLRVIETDRVQPLGTDRLHRVDVRFVAATHHDLEQRVREGRFRADLYQRLAGVVIRLPPLRERPEDIAAIGEHFVDLALHGHTLDIDRAKILRWLHGAEARRYPWPGNARELRNVVRNLLLGLPSGLAAHASSPSTGTDELPARIVSGEATLQEVERWYVQRALTRNQGNVAAAARLLGVDRGKIERRLSTTG